MLRKSFPCLAVGTQGVKAENKLLRKINKRWKHRTLQTPWKNNAWLAVLNRRQWPLKYNTKAGGAVPIAREAAQEPQNQKMASRPHSDPGARKETKGGLRSSDESHNHSPSAGTTTLEQRWTCRKSQQHKIVVFRCATLPLPMSQHCAALTFLFILNFKTTTTA